MAYDTLFEEGIYVDVVSGATEIHFSDNSLKSLSLILRIFLVIHLPLC